MKVYELHEIQKTPIRRDDVFEFFSNAANLQLLTPKHMDLEILTSLPIEMRSGTVIDYRIRILGIPLRWQSEIRHWDPPHSFSDVQTKGPYALWEHEHCFTQTETGTTIEDHVRYAMPYGLIGLIIHALFVRPQLKNLFRFRAERIVEHFAISV